MISVILVALFSLFNFREYQERARDNRRLNDLNTLEAAISAFKNETGDLPDTPDVARHSNELPSESTGELQTASSGWINENLSNFLVKLPTDPVNEPPFIYTYIRDASSFELNAVFEFNVELMQDDGGNNPNVYEVGDNLSLIP